MRTQFPTAVSLTAGSFGDRPDHAPFIVQLIGIGNDPQSPGRLYGYAWQAQSGAWMMPSYNALAFAGGRSYGQIQLVAGNGGYLQALGTDSSTHRLYLAAYYNSEWRAPSGYAAGPLGPDRGYVEQLACGPGTNGLQVIGLGQTDRLPYLAVTQSNDGSWHAGGNEPLTYQRQYRTLQLGVGSGSGRYDLPQLIGIGATDGFAYLIAWQDSSHQWNPVGERNQRLGSNAGASYREILVQHDIHHNLYVFGLTNQGQIVRISRQDADGNWHQEFTPVTLQGYNYVAMHSILFGKRAYLVGVQGGGRALPLAWTDGDGKWQTPKAQPASTQAISVRLAGGADGNLQVLGIDNNQEPRVVMWCDNRTDVPGGLWHNDGRSLAQSSDTGRLSANRLTDPRQAFERLNIDGSGVYRHRYTHMEYDFGISHYQGMARWNQFDLLTHDSRDIAQPNGEIRIVNRDAAVERRELRTTTKPDWWNHPGGCQLVGDYLLVEVERVWPATDPGSSYLNIFWLGGLTDLHRPIRMPALLEPGISVASIAVVDVGSFDDLRYLVAINQSKDVHFYLSNNCLLDDPEFALEPLFEARTEHGSDNMNLLRAEDGSLYLLSLAGDLEGSDLNPKAIDDWAGLYRIDLDKRAITLLSNRHVLAENRTKIRDPHFRYGAGSIVTGASNLTLFMCGRNDDTPGIPGGVKDLSVIEFSRALGEAGQAGTSAVSGVTA
ncbi:hypothetical protein [Burkholderia sp. LMG 32019]|uniref:hypothetical protein n=1 Tax=Burkholderia sp. LMG 32019 TaxID=3158173 RepID=UPI003C2B6F93